MLNAPTTLSAISLALLLGAERRTAISPAGGQAPGLAEASFGKPSTGYEASTGYDAAGRVVERRLGIEAVVLGYEYHPWTEQGGRLARLLSGTAGDPDGAEPAPIAQLPVARAAGVQP
ncbi:MAG: hypothetical protein JXA78_19910, partial [Anaerolineales bacterium]|nr:hypothetical protein [Anaerolineales bacterium]